MDFGEADQRDRALGLAVNVGKEDRRLKDEPKISGLSNKINTDDVVFFPPHARGFII